MTLFAILLALFANRETLVPDYLTDRGLIKRYLSVFESLELFNTPHPAMRFGFYSLPLVFLCWVVGTLQTAWFYGFVDFVVAFLLLVSVVGYYKLNNQLAFFIRRWREKEWQAAFTHWNMHNSYSKVVNPTDLLAQTINGYSLRVNQQLFAPVLWYVIFGTAGLMLFVVTLVASQSDSDADIKAPLPAYRKIAQEFMHTLLSIPARVIALSVALLCLNPKLLAVAVRRFRLNDREAEIILKLTLKIGLDFKELPRDDDELVSAGLSRIHAAQVLFSHLLILWIIFIASFTLLGWIF